MGQEKQPDAQRWTAKRRSALIVSILKGETSVAEAARKHGLTVGEVEGLAEFVGQIAGGRSHHGPSRHGGRLRREVARGDRSMHARHLDLQ